MSQISNTKNISNIKLKILLPLYMQKSTHRSFFNKATKESFIIEVSRASFDDLRNEIMIDITISQEGSYYTETIKIELTKGEYAIVNPQPQRGTLVADPHMVTQFELYREELVVMIRHLILYCSNKEIFNTVMDHCEASHLKGIKASFEYHKDGRLNVTFSKDNKSALRSYRYEEIKDGKYQLVEISSQNQDALLTDEITRSFKDYLNAYGFFKTIDEEQIKGELFHDQ